MCGRRAYYEVTPPKEAIPLCRGSRALIEELAAKLTQDLEKLGVTVEMEKRYAMHFDGGGRETLPRFLHSWPFWLISCHCVSSQCRA